MTGLHDERLCLTKIDKMLPDPRDKDSMILTLIGAGMVVIEKFVDNHDPIAFSKLPPMVQYACLLFIGNLQTMLGPMENVQKRDLQAEEGPVSALAEAGLKLRIRGLVNMVWQAQQFLDKREAENG